MISQITPAGSKPAKTAKSIAASVCPALLKTPPFFAIRGKIWPGLPKSSGFVSGFISAKIVFERSEAEMPVLQPCPLRSTETVKLVSYFYQNKMNEKSLKKTKQFEIIWRNGNTDIRGMDFRSFSERCALQSPK